MFAGWIETDRFRRWIAVLALALILAVPAGGALAQDADGGEADDDVEQIWSQQTVLKTQIELAKILILYNELALPIVRVNAAISIALLQQRLNALNQREQTLITDTHAQFLVNWLRTNPASFHYAMSSVVNMMMLGQTTNMNWNQANAFAVLTMYSFYALSFLAYTPTAFMQWWNIRKFFILREMGINPVIDRAGNVQAGPLSAGQVFDRLRSRTYDTVVLVQEGQTVVLGGYRVLTEREAQKRIPFLSDIPGLGSLFKNGGMMPRDRNLTIFVTPQVIRQTE